MINGTQITIVGNVGQDPELRFTPSGAAVVTFSVAVTPRRLDRETGKWVDGAATWWRINAWRGLAENIAETLTKGQRVIVVGSVSARDWENKQNGEKGTSWEVLADAVGPDLTWATAKVTRAARKGDQVPPPDDPWASSAPAGAASSTRQGQAQGQSSGSWGGGYSDEPPF